MKQKQRFLLFLLTLIMIILCSSCSNTHSPAGTPKSPKSASVRLSELDTELFSYLVSSNECTRMQLVKNPAAYHLQKPDSLLGDISYSFFEKTLEKEEVWLNRLSEIPRDQLTAQEQITYDTLKQSFTLDLKSRDYFYHTSPLNSLSGIQIELPLLLSLFQIEDQNAALNYLTVLKDFNRYFEQLAAFERERANRGLIATDDILDRMIEQCRAFVTTPDSHFLVTSFDNRIHQLNLSESEKNELKQQNRLIVESTVFPAYEKLANSLEKLKGKSKLKGGLCSIEKGKEAYVQLIQAQCNTNEPIDELKNKLEAMIDDQYQTFLHLTLKNLQTTTSLNLTKGNTQENINYLNELSKKYFPELPAHQLSITDIPKELENNFSPAAYLSPAIDDLTNNRIVLNQSVMKDTPNILETLAHEAYPGHLYHSVFNLGLPHIGLSRKVMGFNCYREGWAQYAAAFLLSKTDFNKDQVAFFNTASLLNALIPARLEIGVHYEKWGKDDMAAFLASYQMNIPELIDQYYEIITEIPGYFMTYGIGYMKFNTIRSEAELALGDKLDDKAYHRALLEIGTTNLDILEREMDRWINLQKKME